MTRGSGNVTNTSAPGSGGDFVREPDAPPVTDGHAAQFPLEPGFGAPAIRVQGNKIVDANGQVVRLRGFNHSGTEYSCTEGWGVFDGPHAMVMPRTIVKAMASWGGNTVRVPLNEQCWLGINGIDPRVGGENYQKAISEYVALLNEHGLVVVLDLHRGSPGGAKARKQEPMPNRDHSIGFWTQVATAFKGRGSVAFDLYNEPWPQDENFRSDAAWRCWRDGGCTETSQNTGRPYTAAGMQELVDAVRSTGATNVVFLGGIHWAEAMAKWLTYKPNDPLNNLAASFHSYIGNTYCASQACYNKELAPIMARVPLVATEVGPMDGADGRCGPEGPSELPTELLDWLDARAAGYLGWTWNPWESCHALITSFDGTPTSIWGRHLKERLVSEIRPATRNRVPTNQNPRPS